MAYLSYPADVVLTDSGGVYVAEAEHTVIYWESNAKKGTLVFGTRAKSGSTTALHNYPKSMALDPATSAMFIIDGANIGRVLRIVLGKASGDVVLSGLLSPAGIKLGCDGYIEEPSPSSARPAMRLLTRPAPFTTPMSITFVPVAAQLPLVGAQPRALGLPQDHSVRPYEPAEQMNAARRRSGSPVRVQVKARLVLKRAPRLVVRPQQGGGSYAVLVRV